METSNSAIRNLFCLLAFLIVLFDTTRASAQSKELLQADSIFFQHNLKSFATGNNHRRYRFLKKYSQKNGLNNLSVKTQAIDWLGLYQNVIVEKKGDSDSIVYVVCHYDKIDANIFALVNLFINGSLDILFSNIALSKGAYDNGTGVVSSLSLLHWIDSHHTFYTYRFLFAGMEEYGLRGSRRHVSSLSQKEWRRCAFVINIDMIAQKGTTGITITKNVSDMRLLKAAVSVCEANQIKHMEVTMPEDADSDFHSFQGQNFGKDFLFSLKTNVVGAFLPQRSYFTKQKQPIPVINFSDDTKFTAADYVSILSPVSFGTVHSFHDKMNRVSMKNLVGYSQFLKLYLDFIDQSKFPPQNNHSNE